MIKDLFAPRNVAIIGASRNPAKVGHTILRNAVKSGYKGKIYPINPKAKEILGIRCYKSILDVPDEVDLAVIAVPAPTVLDVAEECCEKGVKYLVVISAGFKEIGGEGVDSCLLYTSPSPRDRG